MAESRNPRRNTYTIYDDNTVGTVQIADEVVAIIAGLAATEVDGVASMGGNITNELVGKLGMKSLSKGVKVEVLPTSGGDEAKALLRSGLHIARRRRP